MDFQKYKTKISQLPIKYSVWTFKNTNPEISELPTKYSVWILKKYNQTVLIISCIENIKKNFFAGLRPARMQGLKNNL
jgi:uncharacterized protein (DUF3820 family)